MSSLSRTFIRCSRRTHNLMKQHQPPGAYAEAEKEYNEKKVAKREAKGQ